MDSKKFSLLAPDLPPKMMKIDSKVLTNGMIKDVMYKRRKLWFKIYKQLYEKYLVNQSRLKLEVNRDQNDFDRDKLSSKVGDKSERGSVVGTTLKTSTLMEDRVNLQLQRMCNTQKKQHNAWLEDLNNYKAKEETKSTITEEFDKVNEDNEFFGTAFKVETTKDNKKKYTMVNLDAENSVVRNYKKILCDSAGIFKFDLSGKPTGRLATSQENRRQSHSRRRPNDIINNLVNKEHDMEVVMRCDFENK